MKSLDIVLNSIDRIKELIEITSKFDCDIDLVSDGYIVNAKSILGVLSLDLKKDLVLNIHDDNIFSDLKNQLKKFSN